MVGWVEEQNPTRVAGTIINICRVSFLNPTYRTKECCKGGEMNDDNNGLFTISMCGGDGCTSSGCQLVRDLVVKELSDNRYGDNIVLMDVKCRSLCFSGPVVMTTKGPRKKIYKDVSEDDVLGIIENMVKS